MLLVGREKVPGGKKRLRQASELKTRLCHGLPGRRLGSDNLLLSSGSGTEVDRSRNLRLTGIDTCPLAPSNRFLCEVHRRHALDLLWHDRRHNHNTLGRRLAGYLELGCSNRRCNDDCSQEHHAIPYPDRPLGRRVPVLRERSVFGCEVEACAIDLQKGCLIMRVNLFESKLSAPAQGSTHPDGHYPHDSCTANRCHVIISQSAITKGRFFRDVNVSFT